MNTDGRGGAPESPVRCPGCGHPLDIDDAASPTTPAQWLSRHRCWACGFESVSDHQTTPNVASHEARQESA